jgi:hypothetical protein
MRESIRRFAVWHIWKKAEGIGAEIYGETLATLERARAQVNVKFLTDMEQAERRDAEHYDRRLNS